ncbi:phage tail assembly chaperone family protein, TAC [Pseudomonas sp. fls2-241-R2A-110]|uniref:phage tail assembly chaperone family protein, TAC n=1 Tax=Pseudomonas sp. fls2-241-R2A-110 TaxID=3040311 RepID=UPI002554C80E|nr:phage tail assembly chaperone family protein, TAC [Pseudomonas sp. fls2-241-R2A-110]
MKLTLESLKSVGAFTGRPVEKEITWTQGVDEIKATVFIRPLGYQAAISDVNSLNGKQDSLAGRLAASVCDENGVPVFTVDDITGAADPERGALDGRLTVALLAAMYEVNNAGKMKSSPPSTSSNTNSPSRSAARSRKPAKG